MVIEGADDDVRGKVMAVFNGAFNVGFSLGSLGLGYVAEAAGYGWVFTLGGSCLVRGAGAARACAGRSRASPARLPRGRESAQ